MNGYDRIFSRNQRYGQEYRHRAARYGSEYQGAGLGPDMSRLPAAGFGGRGVGMYRQWGTAGEAGSRGGGYDRGEYGAAYDRFGGFPGGPQRGMYYGGRGYDAGYRRGGTGYNLEPEGFGGRDLVPDRGMRGGYPGTGGYDRGMRGGYAGGYGGDFAREPFMPEAAYQRHPEFNRPSMRGGGWPGGQGSTVDMDDDEIRQSVRANLYQDAYLDVDRINVEVEDGVVTLTGEVDDFMEARYAWDDAWEVDGVHGVVNQLTVRVDQPAPGSQGGSQVSAGSTAGSAGTTKSGKKS